MNTNISSSEELCDMMAAKKNMPKDLEGELHDFVHHLEEKHCLKDSEESVYWHLHHVLDMHVKKD